MYDWSLKEFVQFETEFKNRKHVNRNNSAVDAYLGQIDPSPTLSDHKKLLLIFLVYLMPYQIANRP